MSDAIKMQVYEKEEIVRDVVGRLIKCFAEEINHHFAGKALVSDFLDVGLNVACSFLVYIIETNKEYLDSFKDELQPSENLNNLDVLDTVYKVVKDMLVLH